MAFSCVRTRVKSQSAINSAIKSAINANNHVDKILNDLMMFDKNLC